MKKTFLKLLLFMGILFLGINNVFADGPSYLKYLNNGFGNVDEFSSNASKIVEIVFYNTDQSEYVAPEGAVGPVDLKYSGSSNSVSGYLVSSGENEYTLYVTFSESLKLNSNAKKLFYNLSSLERITGFQYVDTSSVTDMSSMFANCLKLESIDLSHFNTSKVENMTEMFLNNSTLTSLNFSTFDTSLVENMSSMFYGCTNLTSLNLSNFNTENVTNMSQMFRDCASLNDLNVSNFDTSKVTTMEWMFNGCTSIKTLNLNSFNTPALTALRSMFENCTSLETLYVNNMNTSGVTVFNNLFASCSSLAVLDLRSFNFANAVQTKQMFAGCSDLTTIYADSLVDLSGKVSASGSSNMFAECTSLAGDSGTTYSEMYDYHTNEGNVAPALNSTYAKADGGSEAPGYFSSRTNARDFTYIYEMNNEYTGSAVEPAVVVKDGNTVLTKGTDYTISYYDNINLGEGVAYFKVTGIGDYNGEVNKYFNIVRANIENATATNIPNQLYTGEEIFPSVSISLHNRTLVKDTDYELEYNRNTDVGEAEVIAYGIGNYTGELSIPFNIVGPNVAEATVEAIANQVYTGSALTPDAVVKFGDKTLVRFDDYRIEYENNINIGVATATIIGIGNYSGEKEVTFRIVGDLTDATVADVDNQTFTGNAITPNVVVTMNGKTLVKNTDYELVYDGNNINAGESTITIRAKGENYIGSTTKTFTIVPASITSATIEGNPQEYTGKAVVTTARVTFNGKTLVQDLDYTLEFSNNINIGTATLVVKGKGNLTGTKNGTFEITKANIANATVEDIASQKYTGSEIKPKVVAKFNNETLVEGTDYTLSYDNNIYTGNASVILTGKGRFKETKTVTFKITGANIEEATISSIANQTYIAAPIAPSVKVTYAGKELVINKDYTVSYSNNTNVGTATVTVTGKGSFSETKTATFKIVAANMSSATIEKIADQLYTGEEVKPKVTVKLNGVTVNESDYSLEYSNNIEAGNATVKVIGKNNLTGSKTATFSIKGLDLSNMKIDKIPVQVYTGNEIKPKVIVKFETTMLTEGTDYEVVYSNNVKVGTATVTAKGINKYSGQVKSTFTIYYGITYELNGGVNNSNNHEYYNNKVTTKLLKPTKFGYKFKAWYTSSKYKTKITEIKKGSTGNKTVYAKWTPIKYKVVFNKNGGKGITKDMTLKYNKTYKLNKNKYTKKGYKFIGWNTEKDGSGTSYKNKEEVKNLKSANGEVITLYAQWEKKKYTISYNLNGGTLEKENKTEYYVNTKTFKLNNPKKTGYKFVGWYKNKKFTGAKVTKITKGSASNLTLYAKFEPIKYQVIFNKNGGTGRVNDILAKYGKKYKLTKNSYTRKGYKFTGWNTEKDGSGTSYKNKEEIKNLTTKNNKKINLYAQWKKKTYKITYNLNGGVNNEGNPETYNVKTATIKLLKPTKEGYKFVGWYSNKKLTIKVNTIDKGSTGNKTLYAKWKKLPAVTE